MRFSTASAKKIANLLMSWTCFLWFISSVLDLIVILINIYVCMFFTMVHCVMSDNYTVLSLLSSTCCWILMSSCWILMTSVDSLFSPLLNVHDVPACCVHCLFITCVELILSLCYFACCWRFALQILVACQHFIQHVDSNTVSCSYIHAYYI